MRMSCVTQFGLISDLLKVTVYILLDIERHVLQIMYVEFLLLICCFVKGMLVKSKGTQLCSRIGVQQTNKQFLWMLTQQKLDGHPGAITIKNWFLQML